MYRTDFWTLWEKARVGCFERTAWILSIVKQITSPGGMYETSAQAWCAGKTQRNRVERDVGEGIGIGNTCNFMADSCQCMTKPTAMLWSNSLQLIKINGKKKVNILPSFIVKFFSLYWKKQLADTSLKSLKHDQVKKIKHYHNLD